MIQDKTIDEALFELTRTLKALQALRRVRKYKAQRLDSYLPSQVAVHAAAKRASLDLTRKLTDLRAGR